MTSSGNCFNMKRERTMGHSSEVTYPLRAQASCLYSTVHMNSRLALHLRQKQPMWGDPMSFLKGIILSIENI